MSMNPMAAKPGNKVRFANPSAGYGPDPEKAMKAGLIVGDVYTLTKVEVHDWHTHVWLKGFDSSFNSVQFDDA